MGGRGVPVRRTKKLRAGTLTILLAKYCPPSVTRPPPLALHPFSLPLPLPALGALRVMHHGCSPPVLKTVFHFLSQNIVLLPTEVAAPPKANAMNQAATHLTIREKFSLSRGPARSSPNRLRRPRSQVPAPPGDILGNHLQDVRWGVSSAGCPLEDAPWRVPPGG